MNRLSGENLIGMVPRPVLSALQALENAGYEAFMVGGCVRDMAMGQKPSDWDIATSAQPEQIKAVFSKEKTVDTGIKHGTVTVISENLAMEITTYRTEGTYSDHRHPDVVEYTQDAALDLARRDFTINAMALDRQGRLTDLSGGLDDICRRMVRCVGDPQKRFEEDALRIMRALRFSSRLDFDIERETLAAARSCGHLLRSLIPILSRRTCLDLRSFIQMGKNLPLFWRSSVQQRYFCPCWSKNSLQGLWIRFFC